MTAHWHVLSWAMVAASRALARKHHFDALPAQAHDISSAKSELTPIAMLGQGEQWDMPIGLFEANATFDADYAAHPHVTLSIVLSGDPVMRLDGAFSGRKAHARSAEVMIYPGGSTRRWAYRKGVVVCQAYIQQSYLDAVAESDGMRCSALRLRDDRIIAEDRMLRHALETYLDRARTPFAIGNPHELDALALLIGLHLVRRHGEQPSRGPSSAKLASLRNVTEYIECNLDKRLTIAALARLANASPRALSDAFRRATGVPPHRFITQRRIARAQALLLAGEQLASIASQTGFSSQQHLTTTFRALVGVAPGAWRRDMAR